jgi:hypothetical protein
LGAQFAMVLIDLYKPIRIFGYFLAVVGLLGFWVLITKLQDVDYLPVVWTFIGSISIFHLVLGMGIIKKNKWIFGVFKQYLRLLYVAFPIGTYIAKETLKYIEKNNIERYLL